MDARALLLLLVMFTGVRQISGKNCFDGRYLWYGPPGEVRAAEKVSEEVADLPTSKGLYSKSEHCEKQSALEFVPDGCSLDALDTQRFIDSLKGRRLVLWGDSVSRQFFQYIGRRVVAGKSEQHLPELVYPQHPECELQKINISSHIHVGTNRKETYRVAKHAWGHLSHQCFELVDDLDKYCYFIQGTTAKLCYIAAWDNVVSPLNVAVFNSLRSDDLVLANVGLHQNGELEARAAVMNFRFLLQDVARRQRPIPQFIWRTSSAQHFANSPGGLYPLNRTQARSLRQARDYQCQGYGHREMKIFNLRNKEAHAALYGLDMPVLDVFNVSAMLPQAHPQVLNGRKKADCTHFCMTPGGMYEVWLHLLQNLLEHKLAGPTKKLFPYL